MDLKNEQTARRASLPVWTVVGVAMLVSIVAFGAFIVPTLRGRSLLSEIIQVREAWRSAANDFGRYLQDCNERSRRLQDFPKDLGEGIAAALVQPNLTELGLRVGGEQHAAVLEQIGRASQLFHEINDTLTQGDAWSKARAAHRADLHHDQTAFTEALLRLRNQISQIQGRSRLAAAREKDKTRTIADAAFESLLVEALDLGLQIQDLDDLTNTDQVNDAVNNRFEPSLARLSDLVSRLAVADEVNRSLSDTVATMLVSLRTGTDGGCRGLLAEMQEKLAINQRGRVLHEQANVQLGLIREVQEALWGLVDDRTAAIKVALSDSRKAALWWAGATTVLGLFVLVGMGRVLAANARRHVWALQNSVRELGASRAQLVDISELRTAMARAEDALAQAAASEERARMIVETSLDAAIVADDCGVIVGWNAQAERTFGWSVDEAIGRSLSSTLIPLRYRDAHEQGMRRYIASGEARVIGRRLELAAMHKDGNEFPVEMAIAAATVRGDKQIFSAFIRDISALKAADAERERNIAEIVAAKEALERQATELAEARTRAEGASKSKSEFLATMSHEIRTPLNGVIGALQLLESGTLTDQQSRYIQISMTSAGTLMAVINDILDFSKIEAGRLELSTVDFDLRGVVESVAEMLAVRAAQRSLELVCRIDPSLPHMVHGDGDRLRQIIINLVNNAVKFTERGSITIGVRSEPGPTADGTHTRIRITVSDTGIGIPADRLDRLFKPFSQTDASTTRKYGGTGLGLAISKQLVELMRGTIGVESHPGEGSTFWFTTMLAQPADLSLPPVPVTGPGAARTRVLGIDDNAAVRESLAECCAAWGFEFVGADDAEVGLALMTQASSAGRPFSVLLTDSAMPEFNGFEVAAMVRSAPAIASTPMILLTTALDMRPELARAAGFRTLVCKPFKQSLLLDAIMRAVVHQPDARAAAQRVDHPAGEGGAPVAARYRILLAEDNEINQLIAREMLSRAGHIVEIASTGRAAVELASTGRFDLVLMDCQMPDMDGFDATREIRRLEQAGTLTVHGGRRLPIVALTANALSGDRERCVGAGMDAYATKPINLKQLFETIRSLLSTQASGRNAA